MKGRRTEDGIEGERSKVKGEGIKLKGESSKVKGKEGERSKVKGERGKGRADDRGQMTDGSRRVGNGLTLKVLRKHIERLVNYAEAGDGDRIREELRRIVP